MSDGELMRRVESGDRSAMIEALNIVMTNIKVMQSALESAQAEIQAAVLAERERCARIAEEHWDDPMVMGERIRGGE